MDNFTHNQYRYENVQEIKPGLYVANQYVGKGKVPHPTMFRMTEPGIPAGFCGWFGQPKGWRRSAGYWDATIYVAAKGLRFSIEGKNREELIAAWIKTAQTFL